MSRRALWPTATALATTPPVSPNGASGDEKAKIPTVAEIGAPGATEREVAEVLARIAALHDALGNEHRALSRMLQNQLAVPAERALMSEVAKATTMLTSKDIAVRLKVDAHTVRKWRKAGQIPAGIEIGGMIRWTPESIDAWIAAGGRG